MKVSINNVFIIFTFSIFIILMVPTLFQEGMFMDGLMYSCIARNMSEGIGSVWSPVFSETWFSDFKEHPTLAIWLQSQLYSIFGDFVFVDKLYALLISILNISVVILIWNKISSTSQEKKMFWLPVLLWLMVPTFHWGVNANILENTMGLFSILSIFVLLESVNKKLKQKVVYIVVAALMVFLSFMSKGFPGLFPLAFFCCYFVIYRDQIKLKNAILYSVILIFSFCGIMFLFFYLNQDAYNYMLDYYNNQVVRSLQGTKKVGSRFYIFEAMLRELIIPIIIVAIVLITFYKKNLIQILRNRESNKQALLFLLFGLSASLPIIVSPKQLSFYLNPSIPFFVISLSFVAVKVIKYYLDLVDDKSFGFRLFKYFNLILIVASIGWSIYGYGGYYRDKDLISDVDKIGYFLPKGTIVSIPKSLERNWSLMSYLQRKYYISLDKDFDRQYFLSDTKRVGEIMYAPVNVELTGFFLYKRR